MTSSLTAPPRTDGIPRQGESGRLRTVGRIGIASRGVIYLLLAYLAFDIARHGSAPTQTSSTGALQELEARTGGKLLLVVLAIGLGCYAAWRLFDAVTGREWRHEARLVARCRRSSTGSSVSGRWNSLPVIRRVAVHRAIPSPGSRRSWAGPAGPWRSRWPARSSWERASDWRHGASSTATTRIWPWSACPVRGKRRSRFWVALEIWPEGSLIALFGVYLIEAAVTSNPAQAKSVDQTLRTLVHHPFGALAIGAIALGLLSFGIFSFFDARLRRL